MNMRTWGLSGAGCFGALILGSVGCGSGHGGGTETIGDPIDCKEEADEANGSAQIEACSGGVVNHLAAEPLDGIPFPQPGPVTTTNPAVVGHWSALVTDQSHLAIHSIHRPTGKFLQFGKDHEVNFYSNDKFVWYPPEPCSPYDVGVENCDLRFEYAAPPNDFDHVEAQNDEVDLFCSGHVNVPPRDPSERMRPHTVTIGGQKSYGENSGINASWQFDERMSDEDDAFDNFDSNWNEIPNEGEPRWYPTMTTLADGRFLASGGTTDQTVECKVSPNDPEYKTGVDCSCQLTSEGECPVGCYLADVYANPNADPPVPAPCLCAYGATPAQKQAVGYAECNQVLNPTQTVELLARDGEGDYHWSQIVTGVKKQYSLLYPFVFVLPDLPIFETLETYFGGKVFTAGAEPAEISALRTSVFDPSDPTPEFVDVGGTTCTPGSSAVMYEPGKIMKFGGGAQPSRMTEVIDFTQANPEWKRVGPTSVGRHYSTGVILPDGTVLATGGSVAYNDGDWGVGGERPERAIAATDLFDPASETWCRLADIPSPGGSEPPTFRGYHSQSFLLPDGRVYLGAGGYSVKDHFNHQFFFPPYLFKGPRPEISTEVAPPDFLEITTGTMFELEHLNEVEIDKITLVKLSSTTHNWDMEQRFLELDFQEVNGELSVTAPSSTCYATPGPYMVFALSPLGVPSIGQYLYVKGTCEAAEEPASPPPPPSSTLDFSNRVESDGLEVSCGSSPSAVSLATFQRTVQEFCGALEICPENGSASLTATLVDSDAITVPSGGILLDTGSLSFVDGQGTISSALSLMTSGSSWTAAGIDLGPGRNVVEICATYDSLTHCIEQVIHVGPTLAGPDAGNYRAATIEERYIPLSRMPGAKRLDIDNDDVVAVDLPPGFTFTYYGTAYRTLYIGTNGGIRVTSGAIPASNGSLPAAGSSPHIAAFWDALDVEAAGGVYTYYRGDRFIVSWEGVEHAAATSGHTVSFQVHVFTDGRIEFHYEDTDFASSGQNGGASATIGIQNPAQTTGLLLSLSSTTLLSNGRAFAMAPANCIASAMHASDNTPCEPKLVGPGVVEAVGCGDGALSVRAPLLPTLCNLSPEAFVKGSYETDSSPRTFHPGYLSMPPGEHEITWTLQAPLHRPEGPMFQVLGSELVQQVEVQESRNSTLCCLPSQTVHGLTPSNDTATYGALAPASVCVVARAGDDNVTSGDLVDTLLGGAGNDTLTAGGRDDRLFGGSGHDVLNGGGGADWINGDEGDDEIEGGDGADRIWGSAGDDVIDGCPGDDVIYPGSGVDEVLAGGGNDDIVLLHACEIVNLKYLDGGSGNDRLLLPPGVVLADLTLAGVTVLGIETVMTNPAGRVSVSDCDPIHGDLAIPPE